MIQVAKRRSRELERTEADVVERFVVENHALIRVFNELMHGERGVVRLDDGVGHLGRRHDGKREHHAIRVLLANLGDEKRAHAGTRATAERVAHLETLQAIARFSLLAYDVQDAIDEFGALRVMPLGPVVPGASLSEDEVIRSENLSVRTRAHGIHRSRFEIHEHGSRNVSTYRRARVRKVKTRTKSQRVPPEASLKYTFTRSSCKSASPAYVPVGSIPCSSQMTYAMHTHTKHSRARASVITHRVTTGHPSRVFAFALVDSRARRRLPPAPRARSLPRRRRRLRTSQNLAPI